jgi:hypothetical protein
MYIHSEKERERPLEILVSRSKLQRDSDEEMGLSALRRSETENCENLE